jgi:hypothetical protein
MGSIRPKITSERIEQINKMITDNPEWNRSKISRELCILWDWKGENGIIKDISCRDVLRALDASGKITLPKKQTHFNKKRSTDKIVLMKHDMKQIEGSLSELTPLKIEIVINKNDIMEFKSYIEQYHYLKYGRSVGENIKYFISDRNDRRLACLMFGSAAWSCEPRDTYIGWNREQRKTALKYMSANTRFLILPNVMISYLASHILSLICRRISNDWIEKYGHPLYLIETFVCERFKGTTYKAANWKNVGKTAGKGRNCRTAKGSLPMKEIYLYPLHKRFKEKLNEPVIQI